jgi:hypothetical protein
MNVIHGGARKFNHSIPRMMTTMGAAPLKNPHTSRTGLLAMNNLPMPLPPAAQQLLCNEQQWGNDEVLYVLLEISSIKLNTYN